MARTITLIRHAETNANRVGRWQGHADSGISPHGEDQIRALSARHNGFQPDLLVASDLPRTMRTASALGDPVGDPVWREFNVGEWEGMTSAEISEKYPHQMETFLGGGAVAPVGGEDMLDFRERVVGAFDNVLSTISDGENAVVVTHGGVIWNLISHVMGLAGGVLKMTPSHNTASTHIIIEEDGTMRVDVFNDATHLSEFPTQFAPDGVVVSLYRHGESEANVARILQGRMNSRLTESGREQVKGASDTAQPVGELFTSPLGRTMETAAIIAEGMGLEPVKVEDLIEMSFGRWENLTWEEAAIKDPELYEQIFTECVDMPRGVDGESFGQAGERVFEAISALATDTDHEHIGVVTHGAVIQAYIARVMGIPFATRNCIPIPRNSSMSQIRHTPSGPVLAAYNVAPHLER